MLIKEKTRWNQLKTNTRFRELWKGRKKWITVVSVSCCTWLLCSTQWISHDLRNADMPKEPHFFLPCHSMSEFFRLTTYIIDCSYSCAQVSFLKCQKFPWRWNFGFRELKTQAHRKRSNSDTLTLEIEINVTFQDHALENYLSTVDHFVAIRCSNAQKFWVS